MTLLEHFFNTVSKESGISLFCFTLLCGPDNLCRSLNQSDDAKLKPITTWSPAAFLALDYFFCLTLSFRWCLKIISFLPIDRCHNFCFGLMKLHQEALEVIGIVFVCFTLLTD